MSVNADRAVATEYPPTRFEQLKRQQVASYKQHYGVDGARQRLPWSRVRTHLELRQIDRAIDMIGTDLHGQTVLTVCTGSGIEADRFASRGASVTATDLSPDAIQRLRERYPQITASVADAEQLPFEDASFDVVVVRRGLHHLPRPILGIYEMIRVAKSHVVLMEAQDSWPVRWITRGRFFGLIPHGGKVEIHGNYVYRFTKRELNKLANALFLNGVRYDTEWHHNNEVVEKLHHRFCQGNLGFTLTKAFYGVINLLFGSMGNNMVAVIDKPAADSKCPTT